jgi:hypothetical protein
MKYVITTALVGLMLGLILPHVGGGDPLGMAMLVVLVALPLLGVLVTIDDDLPGDFSNSDGKTPPPWSQWENAPDVVSRAAMSGIGFALDAGWRVPGAAIPWVIGLSGLIVSGVIHKRMDDKAVPAKKRIEFAR